MQKLEAVLGLENVLSESIVQTPLSKVAYSRSTLFPLFFPGERRRAILGHHASFQHRESRGIIKSFCIASTAFGEEQMLFLGAGYLEDTATDKRRQKLMSSKNSSIASR